MLSYNKGRNIRKGAAERNLESFPRKRKLPWASERLHENRATTIYGKEGITYVFLFLRQSD